jgi:predicted NBD/HSP70 family sugar kinase
MAEHAADAVYLGVDVGGTKIGLNAIRENCTPVSPAWIEVPSHSHLGPRDTVKQMGVGVRAFLDQQRLSPDQVAGLGIDSPGPADRNGKIQRSANMHPAWEDFQLRVEVQALLADSLGKKFPVTYENDCNAAALWESFTGNPQGTEVMALLAPGTGLGGGIVVEGHLLRGARGMGGELGHVEIVHPPFCPGAPAGGCGCGQEHCTEAYASMAALMKLLPAALARPEWKSHPLLEIQGEDIWRKRAYQVRGLAAKGDPLCRAIFDWQAEAIGKLCRQVADTIDPHRIVIGGGFVEGGADLTSRVMRIIRETFKKLAFKKHGNEVVIETAAAGDQAGCLGAALSAWQSAHADR